jgi:hypothetical protein
LHPARQGPCRFDVGAGRRRFARALRSSKVMIVISNAYLKMMAPMAMLLQR